MTALAKRSVELHGKQTSLNLEVEFWWALDRIVDEQNLTMQELIEQIVQGYEPKNLTSAVRLFVLKHYQQKSK